MEGKIKGIVFLIWLFLSIAGIFIAGEYDDTEWILIIFGQIFIVFGVIFNYQKWIENDYMPIFLILPFIGLCCAGSGIYLLIGGNDAVGNLTKFFPFFIIFVFFLAGILLIYSTIPKLLRFNKKCTYEVLAKCVGVSTSLVNGNRKMYKVYNPTYSIWWKDREYILRNNVYFRYKYVVGKHYKIKINPENVKEFFDYNVKMFHLLGLSMGIIFVAVSIGVGVLYLITTYS